MIEKLLAREDLHELEMSLYIVEIARPEFNGLINIIEQLKTTYKDRDALEDLDEALQKMSTSGITREQS